MLDPPSPPWIWLAVIAVGVALILFARWYLRRRRYRRHLLERFAGVTADADERAVELEAVLTALRRGIELVRTTFHDSEQEAVVGSAEDRADEGDRLQSRYHELSPDRAPVTSGRNLPALSAAVEAWAALTRWADLLIPELRTEEARLGEALTAANQVPDRLGKIPDRIADVRSAADTAARHGFVVTCETGVLDTVEERVAEVERLAGERRLVCADERLTALFDELAETEAALTSLHQRRADLREQLDRLRAGQARLAALAATAATAYESLNAHSPSVRADLDGNLAEGRAAEDAAGSALGVAAVVLASGNISSAEESVRVAAEREAAAADAYSAVTDRLATVEPLPPELDGGTGR